MIVSLHVATGAAACALMRSRPLALFLGPLDPAVLGGAAAAAPGLRPRGKKLFHREGNVDSGISTGVQLLAAGAIVGFLLGRRR